MPTQKQLMAFYMQYVVACFTLATETELLHRPKSFDEWYVRVFKPSVDGLYDVDAFVPMPLATLTAISDALTAIREDDFMRCKHSTQDAVNNALRLLSDHL